MANVLAVCLLLLFFNNLREKRLVALSSQILDVLKILATHQLKIAGPGA